jgi:hypothetical protein
MAPAGAPYAKCVGENSDEPVGGCGTFPSIKMTEPTFGFVEPAPLTDQRLLD